MIDWMATSTEILYNPRLPETDKKLLLDAQCQYDRFSNHVWLATSGSSGKLKWVVLSKEAILASAAAVNRHLRSDASDTWINPLPLFHVGGLGIVARSFLSHARMVPFTGKWNANSFLDIVNTHKATLTALVPSQLFDLLSIKKDAPPSLRAIIIGGGALPEKVYDDATAAGWKILPSYGLTECASQVATAPLESWDHKKFPTLPSLDHITLASDNEGFLKIKSPALLTAYVHVDTKGCRLIDPKVDGWLTTEDRVQLHEGHIVNISRSELFVKIGGESVDLLRLENILDEERLALSIDFDVALIALPDVRLGHVLCLAVAGDGNIQPLIDRFQHRVCPFERIRTVYRVDAIPRSPLKKILRPALEKLIQP